MSIGFSTLRFPSPPKLIFLLVILGLLTSITFPLKYASATPKAALRAYRVSTSTYPIYSWARALLKGVPNTEVELVTPPDKDPSLWVPNAEALTRYQSASLIALNGARFEQWLSRVSLPPSRTIETAEALRKEWLSYPQAVQHTHGPEGEHSHEGTDGHTWLDPLSALQQADSLAKRLLRDLPHHAQAITKNQAELKGRLTKLDQRWSALAQAIKNAKRPVIIWASHPAYQYLARRYSLPIKSFDLSPDEPITTAQRALLQAAKARLSPETYVILWWEGHPSPEVSQSLEPLKLSATVTVPPFETRDLAAAVRAGREEPQYFKLTQALFEALHKTLP